MNDLMATRGLNSTPANRALTRKAAKDPQEPQRQWEFCKYICLPLAPGAEAEIDRRWVTRSAHVFCSSKECWLKLPGALEDCGVEPASSWPRSDGDMTERNRQEEGIVAPSATQQRTAN